MHRHSFTRWIRSHYYSHPLHPLQLQRIFLPVVSLSISFLYSTTCVYLISSSVFLNIHIYMYIRIYICVYSFLISSSFFFFSNPFHNPTRSPQFFNLLRHTGHVGQTVEMVRLEEIIVVKKRLERNFYLSFLRGMFRTFGLQFHLHLEKCFLSEWQN